MARHRLDELIDELVAQELARRAKNPPRRSWVKRHRLVGGGVVAILWIAVIVLGFSLPPTPVVSSLLNGSHCSAIAPPHLAGSPQKRIAVVDALSIELPNPSFVQTVRMLASRAGFALDYYNANSTTVNLFMNLPRMNYSLIVFRIHSASAALITSEPYSQESHVSDQLLDRIGAARVNQTLYFDITPSSITSVMCGRFPGTVLIAMGCDTTSRTDLADAFARIGARAFIGWNGAVSISHSDIAISLVIEMLLDHQTVGSAAGTAISQLGPDPISGSELRYYPTDQGQSML